MADFGELGEKLAGIRNEIAEELIKIKDSKSVYEYRKSVMDGKTGKPLSAGGEQVRASVRFTAEDADGTIPVIFTFDADGLGEKTLAVFETLYAEGIEAASHADLKDEAQTVRFNPPSTPPKTGDGAKTIFWSLAALSGLAGAAVLLKSRRKRCG